MSLGRSSLDPKRVLTLHCSYCNLLTLSISKLLEHLMTAHNDVSCDCCLYQCCHCSIISTDENLLKEHASVWHPDVNVAIKCISQTKINANLSAESPTTTTNPMMHHDNSSSKQTFACQLCGFITKSDDLLRVHYANVHNLNVQQQQILSARGSNAVDSTIFTDDPIRHRTAPLPAPNFLQQISSSSLSIAASAMLSAATSHQPAATSTPAADSSKIVIDLVNDSESRLKSFNDSSKLSGVSSPLRNLASMGHINSAGKRVCLPVPTSSGTLSQTLPTSACEDIEFGGSSTSISSQQDSQIISSVTDSRAELYICSNCGNGYNKRKYYYEHVFCCGRINPFQCVCGRLSKWRSNFYAHRKRCSVYLKSRLKKDNQEMSSSHADCYSSNTTVTNPDYQYTRNTGPDMLADRLDNSSDLSHMESLTDIKNDVLISDDIPELRNSLCKGDQIESEG